MEVEADKEGENKFVEQFVLIDGTSLGTSSKSPFV